MRALITGINGFVGQHLENFIHDKGVEVFGIENKKTNYIECDITDKSRLKEVIAEVKPDWIFHLAAISAVGICEKDPELARKVNVEGFRNLLSSIDELGLKCRILFTSTSNVYGRIGKEVLSEDDKTEPVSVYAKTKLAAEKIISDFPKVDVVISRSFNHIGPGQLKGFITSDFASQIADIEKSDDKKGSISVGNLLSIRDYTDVRDIVEAYYQLIKKGECSKIYNICSGKGFSGKDILDILLGFSNSEIEVVSRSFRQNDIDKLIGNNDKFFSLTGWKPKISIEKSLKDILDYWRQK
ncbi:GDP-mannose 4,6 dehydratase [Candidatus Woesearchaeota archaeon]|nr:MAG: GDP-mannose 4,6 dehydratase [Candidatus Woesearchaeota archaeon]